MTRKLQTKTTWNVMIKDIWCCTYLSKLNLRFKMRRVRPASVNQHYPFVLGVLPNDSAREPQLFHSRFKTTNLIRMYIWWFSSVMRNWELIKSWTLTKARCRGACGKFVPTPLGKNLHSIHLWDQSGLVTTFLFPFIWCLLVPSLIGIFPIL